MDCIYVNDTSKKGLKDRTLTLITLSSECCYPRVDLRAWGATSSLQTGLLSLPLAFCHGLLALPASSKINPISPACKKINSSQGQGEKTELLVSEPLSAA